QRFWIGFSYSTPFFPKKSLQRTSSVSCYSVSVTVFFSSLFLPTNAASSCTHDGVFLSARNFSLCKQASRRLRGAGDIVTVVFPWPAEGRAGAGVSRPASEGAAARADPIDIFIGSRIAGITQCIRIRVRLVGIGDKLTIVAGVEDGVVVVVRITGIANAIVVI